MIVLIKIAAVESVRGLQRDIMCKCRNLRQIYVPEVKIFHKEDQSSMMSFQNDRKTISKYALQSEKYVVLWALRYKIICLLNCVVDVFK